MSTEDQLSNSSDGLARLIPRLSAVWHSGDSMNDVLSQFVVLTSSRASGCWRLHDGSLRLVGFGWASDMPDEVSQGFQDATRQVPLDQSGLGIVKAALSQQPVVGRKDPDGSGLTGSASWIVKFSANSSLAVPICDQQTGRVIGVFAVSTESVLVDGDALWLTMLRVARELGQAR